ncbi:MAG: hypothetical protein KY468_09745 [Armatimonadetes bacterium]|nr:hypothetical protein [Armatimonadota bacterium]
MLANGTIQSAAHHLAREHADSEPGIQEIYLFPNEEEIRLIEIDSTTSPNEAITPFYFRSDPAKGLPYPTAIALIRPEEKVLPPPAGWGQWSQAARIWPEESD